MRANTKAVSANSGIPPRKLFRLANSAFAKRNYSAALGYCDQLLAQQPDHADAVNMKAKLTLFQGDTQQAMSWFQKAQRLDPKNVENYSYIARILSGQNAGEQAIAVLQQATQINPKNLDIHSLLASLLIKFNNAHNAIKYLEQVMQQLGEDEQIRRMYCMALQMDQQFEKAEEAYQIYLKKYQVRPVFRMLFELYLPRTLTSREQIDRLRENFAQKVEGFSQAKKAIAPYDYTLSPTFNLAFHNQDNKELAKAYCTMLRNCAKEFNFVAPHCKKVPPATLPETIKIGFVSAHMHDHPVGRCYRNMLPVLHEHGGFDVTLFMIGGVVDETILDLQKRGVKVVETHSDPTVTQSIIAQRELDILIFPDIGMEPMSYFLAMARLAHYQCCLTGHPDTTGIDTVDYFISARAYEPGDGQKNYTETLLKAPGIDTVFKKFTAPEKWLSRADFNLPEDKNIYLVPMAIQKMHPDFDDILHGILQKDSDAFIVLFNDFQVQSANRSTQQRVLEKCDALRVRFLDWQPLDHLISLMKLADAVLSTIYFGAGTTSQIAFSFGIPLVSWPDWHARSRMVHGYYQFIGVENPPSATSMEDYVDIAVRMATDKGYREKLSQEILEKHEKLYEDNGYAEHFPKMMQDIMLQQLEAYK